MLAVHVVVVAALVRAFTPEFAARAVRAATSAFTVELDVPPTPPAPEPSPAASPVARAVPERSGAAGAPGRKAEPRDVAAPAVPLVLKPTQAPPVEGTGAADQAGAQETGAGAGAGGVGAGLGAGSAGNGRGGGGAAMPAAKIAGDINSARDYPRASRERRIGSSVIIDLSVGPDGRVSGCRVVQPSPDSEADAITCRLASERFRFRPARDASGMAVSAVYRWKQRWFY
ncbi:TonB family protein [Novosphingobium silvae]|uniref:TonB family protein n=1 Tax=Novosphingobium silvae TaxID=2692619 RepID=UPI00301D9207